MTGFLDWLFGEDEQGATAPNRPFPTQADLKQARDVGAFYDSGSEVPHRSYEINSDRIPAERLRDMRAMATKRNPGFDKLTSPDLIDILARNKLASHRSAIGSLGMNDDQDVNMIGKDIKFGNAAGVTQFPSGADDKLPALSLSVIDKANNGDTASTPLHEATHRGLQHIADSINDEGFLDTASNIGLISAINDPDTNEQMVRAIMHDTYGDVERDRLPKEQMEFLDNGGNDLDKVREYNKLAETIAARMVYQKKKSGPW